MKDPDGFAACREIKKGEYPVVFVTTKNNRTDKLWADKQGAEESITKPYKAQQQPLDQVVRLA